MSETDWLTATYFQDDIIYAADGNAVLFGYSGNDTLDGGDDDDTLNGGSEGPEADIITDFAPGTDKVDFTAAEDFFGFGDLTNGGHRHLEEVDGNWVIHYYDHAITLSYLDPDDLIADDFLFA